MKTLNQETGKRIVAFHVGRGGRFWNAGHVSFIGEREIGEFVNDLFLTFDGQSDLYSKIGNRPNLLEKYYECCDNEDFSFFEKLGFKIGDQIYTDCNGNPVGLSVAEVETGVGSIDLDGDYNTTNCTYLEDCDESGLRLILDYDGWVNDEILDYAKTVLNTEDDE